MSKKSVNSIFEYLTGLAPKFFAERMISATEKEISRLEIAAGTSLSDSHYEFLRIAGNTPAQALNPFLNDRDYYISALLSEYAYLQEMNEPLPQGIVYFSSSEILGENIFLRHGEDPADEPDVGGIDFETERFVCRTVKPFDHWLSSFAFAFRIGQFKHQLIVQIEFSTNDKHVEIRSCMEVFLSLGCDHVFSLYSGIECFDNGEIAAILYADGGGELAGHNLWKLQQIQDLLDDKLNVRFKPQPTKEKFSSPLE